ncbi:MULTISPECIES: penicillin-binding protein 2 [Bacteroides]|jgi:penicillin-binding protein 2|uniref:penicillin-binding protein 2 n=1 Tax=Bacteroides TaxID=816 RepID=UPI000340E0DF|nr:MULTISPECIES: penicillin-binding protein 2 [Bacteroides]MDO3389331.1 penicillin-binding protein 2 [Bacteroides sp. ET489]CDB10751.1 penicillin-binding protein 2 [Bacteroides sp. CAG:633]
MKDYQLEKRKFVIGLAAVIIVFIYILRLFDLQIMTDDYKKNADSNAFLNKIQYPSRGAIYDRNGKLLVFNQPAYDITFVPREVTQLDTADFCRALNITREQFDKRMKDVKNRWMNPGYSKYTHQTFMTQLSSEECGVFQEKLFKFPGFYIQRRTIRQYTYNSAGHVLGDIGEVSKRDIEKDDYYIRGDYIGKQGIERSYETYLRGEKGVEVLLRDAHGRIQGHYMDGQLDRPSIPGKNLTLGIDIDLQMLGERLLQHKIGAIVAIEPSTGEILCMVSSPSFDPHILIGRQRGKNHRLLQLDKRKPLLNRAIMGAYPPGSTFKTTQGLTFLQEGIIHEETTLYPCSHGFSYGSLHVGCHGHASPLSLVPAIATSCNSYFCWGLFRMIGDRKYGSPQKALTVWKDYMVSQGFGYKLGTDLPGEIRGFIPNASTYDKVYRGSWNGLTIISIAIGQGEILATPLQIANLGATIANRGYFITPHVVKEIQDNELDSLYRTRRYTSIDRKYYEDIVEGMRAAVTGSTGSATCRMVGTILPGVEACGKTGTAQNRGKDHSVFMGFAPMDNPKIAIAVYVENGGFGATFGVPIGAMMMDQYLHGKLSPENEKLAEDFSNRVIYYGDEER